MLPSLVAQIIPDASPQKARKPVFPGSMGTAT